MFLAPAPGKDIKYHFYFHIYLELLKKEGSNRLIREAQSRLLALSQFVEKPSDFITPLNTYDPYNYKCRNPVMIFLIAKFPKI